MSNGGGCLVADRIGDLLGVGPVHYHKNSIANVLSLSKICERYRVTYDNEDDNYFIVHGDNKKLKFTMSPQGLYYFDTTPKKNDTLMIQTVQANEDGFTTRQVQQTRLARHLYALLGRPSPNDFIKFVRNNQLKNCPVSVDDANRSIRIYGPDIPALRGKSVRIQPTHVIVPEISPVPDDILRDHSNIHLCIDICFVNNIPFLVTISRSIKLRTVDHLQDTQQETVLKSLEQVTQIYTSRGFTVQHIHADGGFQGMTHDLLPSRLNIAAAGENVPEIERHIRTHKERTRSCIHGMSYRKHPIQLIIANMRYHNTRLNRFPANDGVSTSLSPRTIVWGDSPDFQIDCRLELGSYCEVYKPRLITNGTGARTVGAISLYPAGNSQGGYRFLLLNTGRVVTRNRWTTLPVPLSAIEIVENMASKDKQPDVSKHGYTFSWKHIRNFPRGSVSPENEITDEGADTPVENLSDDDDSFHPNPNESDDITLIVDSNTESSDDSEDEESNKSNESEDDDDPEDITTNTNNGDEYEDQGAGEATHENQGADADNDENQGATSTSTKRASSRSIAAVKENTRYSLRQQERKS